ncbi:MAG: hypothetical protein IT307_16980, partial [Chloroflexi bacterium]|nr:hypothetical protein [Chloroflexota bacterium]
ATVDFMLTVQACEQLGMRAAAELYEHAAVGSGEFPIVYYVPEADALVTHGAGGERFMAPAVDRILGGDPRLELYDGTIIEDARQPFSVSTSDYWGVDTQLGESRFVAREY